MCAWLMRRDSALLSMLLHDRLALCLRLATAAPCQLIALGDTGKAQLPQRCQTRQPCTRAGCYDLGAFNCSTTSNGAEYSAGYITQK